MAWRWRGHQRMLPSRAAGPLEKVWKALLSQHEASSRPRVDGLAQFSTLKTVRHLQATLSPRVFVPH